MNEVKKELSTVQKVAIIGGAIALFVIITVGFFYVFQNEVDNSIAIVMSVVSGGIVAWIILSVSGILKEFSIKGGIFEMSAKIKEEIDSVKKEVSETRIDMIEKFADIKLSVSNIQSVNSQNKLEVNLNQTKEELADTIADSGIPETKIEPDKKIPKEQMEKIDALMNRVKALEDSIDKPVKLSKSEMMKRANYYFYKGNFGKAKELYEKILDKDPENQSALFNLAYSLTDLGQYDNAIACYKKILELGSRDANVLNNIGVVYARKPDDDEALRWYHRSLELKPNDALTLANISKALRRKGKFDEAFEYLKKSLDVEPNNGSTLTSMANYYLYKRQFGKAKEYATKALSAGLTEKIDQITVNLMLGNISTAVSLCDAILSKKPNDDAILYNKACAMSLLNKKDEAIELLKKASEISPYWKISFKTDPDFDNIRDDPRVKEFEK